MRKYMKDIIAYLCLILSTVATLTLISARQCATELSVAHYAVAAEKLTASVRIVQLSDLHGYVYGEENCELVALVEKQQPDLILMTGDMLDKSAENPEVVRNLIRDLRDTAPVFYGFGNHEDIWIKETGVDLASQLEEAGAVVLELAFTDTVIRGQSLRIGGYHGYYRYWGMQSQVGGEEEFAENFEDTDRTKLLLGHIATVWTDWQAADRFPVDYIFTGHYHGGQIRLPLIGGLYAPYVGWFPRYTEGVFVGEQGTVILSTGLGASPGIPRINNLPQIVVVDLIPKT
jgi:predicted MPP superfamily phosphohydrolase